MAKKILNFINPVKFISKIYIHTYIKIFDILVFLLAVDNIELSKFNHFDGSNVLFYYFLVVLYVFVTTREAKNLILS